MVTFSSVLLHPIATCLYGIMGSYFLNKRQMKKQAQECNVKIVYDVQGPIDIGSGLTSLFPNVQLMYNETKIDFKIQYITGTIKNTDKKRTVTTLNLPFELINPKNCEVLEAKILESPKEEIKVENKGNFVEISTPETFLPQEQIRYCILYKGPDIVKSDIKLKTRIADVDVISTEEIEAEDKKNKNKKNTVMTILYILMVIYSFFLSYYVITHFESLNEDFIYWAIGGLVGSLFLCIYTFSRNLHA